MMLGTRLVAWLYDIVGDNSHLIQHDINRGREEDRPDGDEN
jgi:hypothetical protein